MAKQKTRVSGQGMDLGAVSAGIDAFLEEAKAQECYSISRLCLALGISRETLRAWRQGFACAEDVRDAGVLPNDALAACAEQGMLHVERYWEESEKPSVQSKYTKLLEDSGALGAKKEAAPVGPFDMGALKKHSR